MHATPSRTRRSLLTRLSSSALGVGLSLGLVLAVAWVGVWTAEEASSEKGVEYGGRTAVAHVRATRVVTLTKPAGTKAGDLLVASFSVDHRPKVSAVPAGWTALLPGRLTAGRSSSMFAYYRAVTAADAQTSSWSWRLDTRQDWSGGIARYRGVDTDHPVDTSVSVASKGSAGSTIVVPGVRTTKDGAMLIGSLGAGVGRSSTTPPAGWTEAWDVTRGTDSEHAYSPQQVSGATGDLTWKVAAARPRAGWMTALRPVRRDAPTATPTTTNPTTPPTPTPTPTAPTTTPGTPQPPVLVGAGDIAGCAYTQDDATAALVRGIAGTVFALGDNAYDSGTAAEFASCYDPTWGTVKDRTRPVVGNHEYLASSTAAPYFAYFGAAAGGAGQYWYSYDVGTDWHVVVLNSNCTIVGCTAGSPQEQWLRADLAASTRPCTVAMWHHPRFSSGEHGNDASTDAFWAALYADGAEVVLNGHDHDYERFAPQNPSAVADPTYGIREFVVGTGGKDFRSFSSTADANSQVRSIAAHGVLKLTLNSGSYDWTFVPIPGDSLDESGTTACHGAPS